ncbi:MAG: adenylate/guanylate cyclase domain-containing protein [Opitutus sp.]|nr:adenylate/guanylate cyclase domain-containing protein [Opitutus sp.]
MDMKRIRKIASVLIAAFLFSYALLRAVEIKITVNGSVLPISALWGAVLATCLTGAICVVWQVVAENRQKERIRGLFGTHVSAVLVERMVKEGKDPALGGHEVELTAYFSDVQSFAVFSETLTTSRLIELMNEYLTACTDIVQQEGGTLDKYIGGAIVAMFGAPVALPDHACRACVAAHRVQLRLGELSAKWRSEGAKWPGSVSGMRSRIGLNSGPCVVGNMGSRTRFNYTMMGANVSLASRMESGAGSWGVFSMCTEATRAACLQHGGDRVVFRPLGRVGVMGHAQPVPIHEIVGLKESIASTTRECIGIFQQGLTRYLARDWTGAIALFHESARLESLSPDRTPGVKTNPSLIYIELCRHYQEEPPPEKWDGIYVLREK